MFPDKITVFHLNGSVYEKRIFENLRFEHSKGIAIEKLGDKSNNSGTIIFPTTEKIDIFEKDIVIEGVVDEELNEEKRLSYLKSKYHVYEVVAVDDLRVGNLSHYEIEVK